MGSFFNNSLKGFERMFRGALSIALVVAISGCTSTSPVKESVAANYDYAIGVVDATCLAIKNGGLLQGEAVTVVSFDESQRVLQAFVDSSDASKCKVADDRQSMNEQAGYSYYSLIGLPAKFEAGAAFTTTFDKDQLQALDLNANGNYETVSHCLSTNGAKVALVENGTQPIWSADYYLGEGQTPTCQ